MPLETTAALRVDLLDPGAPQIIHAVQDDSNSRKIAFSIYAGGAQWAVPNGTLVTVRYKKSDGTAGFLRHAARRKHAGCDDKRQRRDRGPCAAGLYGARKRAGTDQAVR